MFDWCLQSTLRLLSNNGCSVESMIGIKVMIKILTVLAALATIFGVAYTIVKDKLPKRSNNLDGIKDILVRIDEIRSSNKHVQELELNAVPCLKGLKWIEADALLEKDIGLTTLSNLRSLSRRNYLAVHGSEIFIPSREYLLRKNIRNILSLLVGINFLCSVLFFLYLVILEPSNLIVLEPSDLFVFKISDLVIFELPKYIVVIGSFLYILLSELVALYRFDVFTSLSLIKSTGDIANNNISISEDFEKDLQRYNVWKIHYKQKNKRT